MTPRQQFLNLINRKSNTILPRPTAKPSRVPRTPVGRPGVPLHWFMSFFNEKTAAELLGEENIPGDCLPEFRYNTRGSDRADWDRKLAYTKACGHFTVTVGWSACIAFGHGGPGEFAERMTEVGDGYRFSEFETGVMKEVRYNPHFYHHYDYPAASPDDFDKIKLPDPRDPARYVGIAEEAAYYKEQGYIACASLNGFFSGLHYFLYPYDLLLADLLLEPEFVGEMLERLGNFNISAADELLKHGVEMINFCDDLGSGESMLISPALYRKFFFPWHKRLADLCHTYGAYLHMHSHGNINAVMDDIYETGVDILNPCDPCDGMDLAELKRKYGDRILFAGGVDKFFFEWSHERQKEYLDGLAERTGGGFILMDSGGVPENVGKERFDVIRGMFHGYL